MDSDDDNEDEGSTKGNEEFDSDFEDSTRAKKSTPRKRVMSEMSPMGRPPKGKVMFGELIAGIKALSNSTDLEEDKIIEDTLTKLPSDLTKLHKLKMSADKASTGNKLARRSRELIAEHGENERVDVKTIVALFASGSIDRTPFVDLFQELVEFANLCDEADDGVVCQLLLKAIKIKALTCFD